MSVIGLTGSSGSGKTTAADILRKYGAYIIDCDRISREITLPGEKTYTEIINEFGEGIKKPDGTIDRRALGEIVFSDRDKLKTLEDITHRAIIAEVKNRLSLAKEQGFEYVVIDAPLLIESGLDKLSDSVWLICCDEDIRIKRVAKRDELPEPSVRQRFKNQTPSDELKKYANVIIDTSHIGIDEMENIIKEKLNVDI